MPRPEILNRETFETAFTKLGAAPLTLAVLDLDHFKEVNDTLGHDLGDLLLTEAARRIRQCVGDSDTVARLGGDEFAVLVDRLAAPDDVARVLQQYDQSTIDIIGHTDSSGGDAINQPLSERRASSVAGELVRRGVLAERLFVAGNSSRNPVASNDTAQGKAQNRRVEILIRPFRG